VLQNEYDAGPMLAMKASSMVVDEVQTKAHIVKSWALFSKHKK
jgi:hypothetical protein